VITAAVLTIMHQLTFTHSYP